MHAIRFAQRGEVDVQLQVVRLPLDAQLVRGVLAEPVDVSVRYGEMWARSSGAISHPSSGNWRTISAMTVWAAAPVPVPGS